MINSTALPIDKDLTEGQAHADPASRLSMHVGSQTRPILVQPREPL